MIDSAQLASKYLAGRRLSTLDVNSALIPVINGTMTPAAYQEAGGGGGLGPYDLTLNGEPLTLNGEQLRMTPNLMLLGGEPLLFNGEYLTLGN